MTLRAGAFAGLLLLVGCSARQHAPVAVPTTTRVGVTSVRLLEGEAKPPQPADAEVDRITPAFSSDENKLPVYPQDALEAGCQQGVVPVRVYIGADGNVASIKPVPNRPVADDQCHSAFWAATCAVVQEWRFAPAFRQTPKPGPDTDRDGRPDRTQWEQTPVMIYSDFEFTFRVVEGRGEVLSR